MRSPVGVEGVVVGGYVEAVLSVWVVLVIVEVALGVAKGLIVGGVWVSTVVVCVLGLGLVLLFVLTQEQQLVSDPLVLANDSDLERVHRSRKVPFV